MSSTMQGRGPGVVLSVVATPGGSNYVSRPAPLAYISRRLGGQGLHVTVDGGGGAYAAIVKRK